MAQPRSRPLPVVCGESSRVQVTGPGRETQWGRIDVPVKSNVVEFDVQAAMPAWQSERLQAAVQGLSSTSTGEAHHAVRVPRFLNTEDSTKALAHFWGANEQAPIEWDLKLGLFWIPVSQAGNRNSAPTDQRTGSGNHG